METQTFLNDECAICLDNLGDRDYVILEGCLHKYHKQCINDWFIKKKEKICPICNKISENSIIIRKNKPRIKTNTQKIIPALMFIKNEEIRISTPITNPIIKCKQSSLCSCCIS